MNNEKYQKRLEECSAKKFSNKEKPHYYQGDAVSGLIFSLSKKWIGRKILDVGAGTGALVSHLKSMGYENAQGIDLYPKVDFIKKGLITKIDFEDSYFDTLFCTEVIEHLDDKQIKKGVSEIERVLKEKGSLIISVPYNENLEHNSFVCPQCKHKFHKVGHLQSFDKKRIKKILNKQNFTVEKIMVLPLSFMAKLPYSQFYWRILMLMDRRLDFGKTMLIVATNNKN